jgi:hypothetical protein
MTADWLGSPQHFVGGGAVAAGVMLASVRLGVRPWICLTLGVGTALVAEAVVEVLEYWLFNADLGVRSAAETYYDTIADLANTLVGAITGGLLAALCVMRYRLGWAVAGSASRSHSSDPSRQPN